MGGHASHARALLPVHPGLSTPREMAQDLSIDVRDVHRVDCRIVLHYGVDGYCGRYGMLILKPLSNTVTEIVGSATVTERVRSANQTRSHSDFNVQMHIKLAYLDP